MARKKTDQTAQTLEESVAEQTAATIPTPEPAAPIVAKKVYPKLRSWAHDNAAGVELNSYASTDEKLFEIRLQFRDGKPSEDARRYMKDNGFRWEPNREPGANFMTPGAWVHKVAYEGAQDRLTAERVYFNVVETIRKEKGIEPEPAIGR